jgi:hypothetical protein
MASIIQKITEKAELLRSLRESINAREAEMKAELDAMKTERDALQATLLADMQKHKMLSVKVESGESFIRGKRQSIEIVSEMGALKWALEHKAVGVDKRLVAQKLKGAKEIPNCFELVESEFISARKPTAKQNGTDSE